MTRSNYQIAFKLSVAPAYLGSNSLQFLPGAITKQLLQRYDMLIKNDADGYSLYVNSNSSISELLPYIKKATGQSFFDFEIKTVSPAFIYDEGHPANWVGQLVYDSNKHTRDKDGIIQLTEVLPTAANTSVNGSLTIHFNDVITTKEGYAHFQIVPRPGIASVNH